MILLFKFEYISDTVMVMCLNISGQLSIETKNQPNKTKIIYCLFLKFLDIQEKASSTKKMRYKEKMERQKDIRCM